MPIRKSWLPREGLVADPFFSLFSKTALNPALLLPLLLLARFTKKGEDLSVLHPTALSRVKTLFFVGLARWLSSKYSDGVMNNFTRDKYDWPNEIAVVTGGAGGIGAHVVKLLAERGTKVVVLDIQPMTFETPSNVYYFKCDLTSPENLAEVAREVRAKVGEPTVLVNNAGVARGKTILDTTERDLKFTFEVNAFAHFHTVREFLPAMIRRDHGMVVTVASYAAWLCVPNMVDYGASKAAAMAFHEGLAAELKTRYRANRVRTVVVNQGYTRTPLFTGYHNDSPFFTPPLCPETVADGIVGQILTGRSGHVTLPAFGNALTVLRGMPFWFSYGLRAKSENIMTNWTGRQVVQDLDKHYTGRDAAAAAAAGKDKDKDKDKGSASSQTESSTVLVPTPDGETREGEDGGEEEL